MTEPSQREIDAASKVLHIWGGLRNRYLDNEAIVRRMLTAAAEAREEEARERPA